MAKLLNALGSPQGVFEATADEWQKAGAGASNIRALQEYDIEIAEAILKQVVLLGDFVWTADDAAFPLLLSHIDNPPVVLYGRGQISTSPDEPYICVIGMRKASGAGFENAIRIAAGLAGAGMTVVSGGAEGIDAAAHQGALRAGGRTIAFCACGLDVNYPMGNQWLRRLIVEKGGLLLSEYIYGTSTRPEVFATRNRLMSGIAVGTCVVEAELKSGCRLTVGHAREQQRDVYAVPGSIQLSRSACCNMLIKEGAKLVTCAADIVEEYMARYPSLDKEAGWEAETQQSMAPPEEPVKDRDMPTGIKRRAQPSGEEILGAEQLHEERKAHGGAVGDNIPPASKRPPAIVPENGLDDLPELARRIYMKLEPAPRLLDDLAAMVEAPISQVMAALTELELAGYAECVGRQMFKRGTGE